ncbi:MAG: endonuclease/exonuclease/phosphatase family protein [Flavobacteriales bacterium]|nr:endonuclease/exonuclease/phosphatase family protein [Flavobacteriales bacterium]
MRDPARPEAVPATPLRKRFPLWQYPLWWANGLAAGALLLTYLAPHLSPEHFWMLGLLALAYPYQLLVHLGFLLWWALFRPRRMLLSVAVVALGWGHVGDHYQLLGSSSAPAELRSGPVKLMSWNVRLFDLYNWTGNKVTRDSIFAALHRADADILCLQEFFQSSDKRYFKTRSALMKDFRYGHLHERYSQKTRFDQHFGIATFSAHPIVAKGHIAFPDNPNNQCIWSDIALGADTIRVYNAHLASYHLGDKDVDFIAGLDTVRESEALKRGGLRILKLLRAGMKQRASEVRRIAEHMAESPHPVVYCGDMNDVPMSYGYHLLRGDMRDAFRESGSGSGGTYIGKLPSLRIDHILHDPRIRSWDFTTHREVLSDHRAISCVLGVE